MTYLGFPSASSPIGALQIQQDIKIINTVRRKQQKCTASKSPFQVQDIKIHLQTTGV